MKHYQSCIATQCIEFVYHVGNVEELRSTVNHGFIPVNTTPQMP